MRLPSELGRTEFAMVSLVEDPDGLVAYPTGKGSGAITSFAQADGFVRVEALADHLPQGARVGVDLFTPAVRVPDLVIIGSHCVGLDLVTGALVAQGLSVRTIAVGSMGGLQALARGECDLAPIHLLDPGTGHFNAPFLTQGQMLIPGWRRMQGIVHRPGHARFQGKDSAAALADPDCMRVARNQGAGARILIDSLLAGRRPAGCWNHRDCHCGGAGLGRLGPDHRPGGGSQRPGLRPRGRRIL